MAKTRGDEALCLGVHVGRRRKQGVDEATFRKRTIHSRATTGLVPLQHVDHTAAVLLY